MRATSLQTLPTLNRQDFDDAINELKRVFSGHEGIIYDFFLHTISVNNTRFSDTERAAILRHLLMSGSAAKQGYFSDKEATNPNASNNTINHCLSRHGLLKPNETSISDLQQLPNENTTYNTAYRRCCRISYEEEKFQENRGSRP
ncbi:MAG: hypothetical protein P1U34_03710 [Coxiellaceae bacterium]|nr:hypothetical protein [Coxiellaceae bacterium]